MFFAFTTLHQTNEIIYRNPAHFELEVNDLITQIIYHEFLSLNCFYAFFKQEVLVEGNNKEIKIVNLQVKEKKPKNW